jgi:hypothetical protein
MSQKSSVPPTRALAEKLALDIRRATRKHHSVAPTASWAACKLDRSSLEWCRGFGRRARGAGR